MKVSRILFLFAVMVAIGMGLVRLRTETQQAGFMIGRLQAEQRELKRECLDLQLSVACLRAPGRLQEENTKMALDMSPPGLLGPTVSKTAVAGAPPRAVRRGGVALARAGH